MNSPSFSELNIDSIRDTIVILDIDGTLLTDSAETIDSPTAAIVGRLREQGNMIYLCSNGFSHKRERNRRIANELDITYYETEYKKPLKQAVYPIVAGAHKPVVVIGDKFLTDGLLALNLGVPFIRVRSLRSSKDALYVRVAYALDDVASAFFGNLPRGPWYKKSLYNDPSPVIPTILTQPPLAAKHFVSAARRLVREQIKKVLFAVTRQSRYQPFGGPLSVIKALRKGLDGLPEPYHYNPWQHEVTETVGVVAGVDTLRWAIEQKKRGFIKTIVAGPNIVVTPFDEQHLIQSPEIDRIVVPSQWNKNWWLSFDQSLDQRVIPWAAGVSDHGAGRDAKGVCVVYSKNTNEKLFHKIIETLWTHKLPIVVSKYGQFMQHEYFRILKKARMMIYISDFESQGLALHEAWMADIPTLVYDGGEVRYKEYRWKEPQIAAPYFDPQCGMLFAGESDFETKLIEFLEKYDAFTPRNYSLTRFTPEISARKYLEVFESISG